jgi:hypothetical protein
MAWSELEHRAFLVATLDTSKQPYQLIMANIYSESASTLTNINSDYFNLDVISVRGSNFIDAEKRMLQYITANKYLHWVIELLPENTQREIIIKDIIT